MILLLFDQLRLHSAFLLGPGLRRRFVEGKVVMDNHSIGHSERTFQSLRHIQQSFFKL
jgi:hypothetical protein